MSAKPVRKQRPRARKPRLPLDFFTMHVIGEDAPAKPSFWAFWRRA